MHLQDFPRPRNDNRRGVHWSTILYPSEAGTLSLWIAELQQMHVKWVKTLDDGGGSSLPLCEQLLAADIFPIVRLYRQAPNPGHLGGRETETVKRLVGAGVRYFESKNEPDVAIEWKNRVIPPGALDIVVDNFIFDAGAILAAGGLPALPAMSVGGVGSALEKVVARGRADLFDSGAWIAIHNYTLNHPLDYPYDAVNQAGLALTQEEYDKLGAWAWDNQPRELINEWRASDKNPGKTITDDPLCFLGWQVPDEAAMRVLGHKVPILSTEGGPCMGWRDDRRYPRLTPQMHADWVVAINDFLQGDRQIHGVTCPESYFTMCFWLLANRRLSSFDITWESQSWYSDWWNTTFDLHGQLPVVDAVKSMPNYPIGAQNEGVLDGFLVRADIGDPLPDLRVELLQGSQVSAATVAGSDGGFHFAHLLVGAYDLSVGGQGVVQQGINVVAAVTAPLIVRLGGGKLSTLSGRVVDQKGTLKADVEVTLQRDGGLVSLAHTGADGAFRFESLPLGVYQLSIPGSVVAGIALDSWGSKSVKLTAGAPAGYRYVKTLQRLLPPAETGHRDEFFGTITGPDGNLLKGIKVQMSWVGAAAGTQFPVTTSGADPYAPGGLYKFVHTRGMFRLLIVQNDWPSDAADGLDTANVPGPEGQQVAYEVNFQLQGIAGTARVQGQVSGAPAGTALYLSPASPPAGGPAALKALLETDGTFAFTGVAPGEYQLSLDGAGLIATHILLEADGLFTLLFPMRSGLQGQVLNPSTGLVAVLYAPAPWGWTRQAPLDADGKFAFQGLPAGRFRLQVADQMLEDVDLTGENILKLAAIDLFQVQHSVLRGKLVDASGQGQADALLTLTRQGDLVAQGRTETDGSYRFGNLPAGTYSLDVEAMGLVASGIILDGAQELVQDLIWSLPSQLGLLTGRVLAHDGSPAAHKIVRLLRDGAELSVTQTDADGVYRFSRLTAGSYALAVGTGGPVVSEIVIAAGATVTQDITLAPEANKVFAQYLLFSPPAAGAVQTRLALQMALPYLQRSGASGGFSLEQAAQAAKVVIVGDLAPAGAEDTLRAAGCQVSRLSGDVYALAAAFDGLVAGLA